MRTQTVAPTQFATETKPAVVAEAESGPVPPATKKARATDPTETPATTNHDRACVRTPSQMKTNQLPNPQLTMASTTRGHHRRRFVACDCSVLPASESDRAGESAWSC